MANNTNLINKAIIETALSNGIDANFTVTVTPRGNFTIRINGCHSKFGISFYNGLWWARKYGPLYCHLICTHGRERRYNEMYNEYYYGWDMEKNAGYDTLESMMAAFVKYLKKTNKA